MKLDVCFLVGLLIQLGKPPSTTSAGACDCSKCGDQNMTMMTTTGALMVILN